MNTVFRLNLILKLQRNLDFKSPIKENTDFNTNKNKMLNFLLENYDVLKTHIFTKYLKQETEKSSTENVKSITEIDDVLKRFYLN